jgi:hypothetical protein
MTTLLQQQLLRAQQRMKFQADKHRTDHSFSVGDHVWLKLQPYAQRSVASRVSPKLSYHYFSPYEIESKINEVAYKLKLPANSSMHPIFNVSLLKKVQGNITSKFIPLLVDIPSVQTPEMVLDRHGCTKNKRVYYQLLVKWMDLPPELATWEDEDELIRHFPSFTAWARCHGTTHHQPSSGEEAQEQM